MQTVVETPAFLASARDEGISETERAEMVTFISQKPDAGDVMKGTGGARKVRFAGHGKGKSGGFRVITFFGGEDMPVFLLDVFGKGTAANLSKAEQNELKAILTTLPQKWREAQQRRIRILKR